MNFPIYILGNCLQQHGQHGLFLRGWAFPTGARVRRQHGLFQQQELMFELYHFCYFQP